MDRFSPEYQSSRDSVGFVPFGVGPRNCIGLRFAMMEAKIALISLLKRYRIDRCDKTLDPLPTSINGVAAPSEGVYVKMSRRS